MELRGMIHGLDPILNYMTELQIRTSETEFHDTRQSQRPTNKNEGEKATVV